MRVEGIGDCVVGGIDANGNTIASCGGFTVNLNPNDPTAGIPIQQGSAGEVLNAADTSSALAASSVAYAGDTAIQSSSIPSALWIALAIAGVAFVFSMVKK